MLTWPWIAGGVLVVAVGLLFDQDGLLMYRVTQYGDRRIAPWGRLGWIASSLIAGILAIRLSSHFACVGAGGALAECRSAARAAEGEAFLWWVFVEQALLAGMLWLKSCGYLMRLLEAPHRRRSSVKGLLLVLNGFFSPWLVLTEPLPIIFDSKFNQWLALLTFLFVLGVIINLTAGAVLDRRVRRLPRTIWTRLRSHGA